ncbi:MAG: ZIP family metal transporter [Candidatus Moraniibacteriota bacterium]|jgi:zinc and cadmium transporter
MILYIILSAFAVMLASLVGVLFVWKGFGGLIQKNSKYLTAFAGGVFAVLAYSLIRETFHLSESILITISSILFGIILIEIITRFMPSGHHHHSLPPDCGNKHSCIDAQRMMWSDAFHNVGDGILIVGAFMVNVHVGIVATVGIFLHEIVQEISEFFVFKEAGYSTKKALLYNFIISGSIFIGIALTLLLSSVAWLMAPLMGFAAGGFIYVLIRDIIPHTFHNAKKTSTFIQHLIIFLVGIVMMFVVNNIVPHSHEHHAEHDPTEISHDIHP